MRTEITYKPYLNPKKCSFLVPTRYVTAIKLRNTLVPKLQLGNQRIS